MASRGVIIGLGIFLIISLIGGLIVQGILIRQIFAETSSWSDRRRIYSVLSIILVGLGIILAIVLLVMSRR